MSELLDYYKAFYQTGIASDLYFLLLFVAVVFDIILGSARAWANNEFSSRESRRGIASHGGILLIMLVVCPLLHLIGLGTALHGFIGFLALSYASSIVGNLALLGVPIPKGLQEFLNSKLEKEFYNKVKLDKEKDGGHEDGK